MAEAPALLRDAAPCLRLHPRRTISFNARPHPGFLAPPSPPFAPIARHPFNPHQPRVSEYWTISGLGRLFGQPVRMFELPVRSNFCQCGLRTVPDDLRTICAGGGLASAGGNSSPQGDSVPNQPKTAPETVPAISRRGFAVQPVGVLASRLRTLDFRLSP